MSYKQCVGRLENLFINNKIYLCNWIIKLERVKQPPSHVHVRQLSYCDVLWDISSSNNYWQEVNYDLEEVVTLWVVLHDRIVSSVELPTKDARELLILEPGSEACLLITLLFLLSAAAADSSAALAWSKAWNSLSLACR